MINRLAGAIFAFSIVAGVAAAAPKNAMDRYVAKPDASFGWVVDHTISGPGYHGAVLHLTSQTWLNASKVDKPVWRHWLTVIVPDNIRFSTGYLYINGGSDADPAPKDAQTLFSSMAVETHSVVAELDDVPNEPLRFAEQPDRPRTEDEIVAYQEAKFLKDRNPLDLLLLPMAKSGSAAMTAVQQYLQSTSGGEVKVDRFVVAGGSKRAWTAWLVGAIDPRVAAIVPIVINVLDVDATTRHHWEAMGYFSPALKDYVDNGLIPGAIGTRALNEVNALEDPLSYRDRPSMRIPKFVIDASGDQYFPPDNTRFGYHLLPEVKRLRILPNSGHSTAETDQQDSILAFYDAVLNHQPIPDYSWEVRKDGAIVVKSEVKPADVRLWQATNPSARDFRITAIGKAFTSTPLAQRADGTWVAEVEAPSKGWTAYFVELTYPSRDGHPFKFTTEVSVIPDTLPFNWKDARPIIAPAAK